MPAVNISAYFDFVYCFIESFFGRAKHLIKRFHSKFVRVQRNSFKQIVDLPVLHFNEVLAHCQVEERRCACVVQVVVLEVVPEAGLNHVVVLYEVFPNDLNVEEPVFELQQGWGLILVYGLNCGSLTYTQFGQLASAWGSQHACNEVVLRLGVVAGEEGVYLLAGFFDRVAQRGFEELA